MANDWLDFFRNPHPERRMAEPVSHQWLTYKEQDGVAYYALTERQWTKYLIRPNWIRLVFDCGTSLPGVRCYSMTPGYWLKRDWNVGDSVRAKNNMVTHYDSLCRVIDTKRGPYTNKLVSRGYTDFGGDVGIADAIVLQYHDESFTYALGFGWVAWSKVGSGQSYVFNRFADKPTVALAVCGTTPL